MMPPNSVRIYDNEKSAEIIAIYSDDRGVHASLVMDWDGKVKFFSAHGWPQYTQVRNNVGWRRRYFDSLPPEARRSIRINTESALFGENS